MSDEAKTRDQIIGELDEMRQKVAELESQLRQSTEPSARWGTEDAMLKDKIEKGTELEKELGDTERLYRTLVETAKDIIWTVNLNLRYTYVSPSVTEVLGYTVEEIMALRPLDLLTPDSRAKIIKAFQEELALEASGPREKYTSRTEQIEQYHKDGSTRWEEITTTFLRDRLGKPIGILGISHDITEHKRMTDELREARDQLVQGVKERTRELLQANARLQEEVLERKQAEDALRAGEQRLELVLEGADLGLWDWQCQSGEAVVNRRSAEIIGYALEEIQQSFDFWKDLLHPEDRIRAVETVYAHLEGRTDYYEDEYRVKTKSGEWKWIFSRGKVVERDPEGKPLRMAGTYRDITNSKITDEALRERERRYRQVVEKANDIIYRTDANGFFVFFNPVGLRITGYSQEEISQKHYLDLIHPDYKKQVDRFYGLQFVKRVPDTYHEVPIITKQGKTVWIGQNVHLLVEGDTIVGFQSICRDITDRKRAADELAKAGERVSRILESITDGFLALDQEMRLTYFNKAAEQVLERESEEVIGKGLLEAFPELRGSIFEKKFSRALREKTQVSFETYFEIEPYQNWYEVRVYPFEDGISVYFQVTTERKRAQEALQEKEERYRYLVENIEDLICTHDLEGNILFLSSGPAEFLGSAPADMVGTNLRSCLAPEVRDQFDEYLSTIQREGRASGSMLVQNSRGERRIWEYRNTLHTEPGAAPIVLGVARDVTERRRAEQVERRLATAIDQATEGVLITNTDGTIQYVNPGLERMTGYSRDELLGQTPRILKSGEHSTEFYQQLWDTIKAGNIWSGRLTNRRKDERLYHEDVTITPVKDASGKIISFVAVKRDITDHLELSNQLLQAQKMEAVGTLAGGVAHDFNNILQVALGYSELILGEEELPGRYRADLQKIREAARRGADLVQRLLTFSRKTEIKPQPLNLNRRITELRKMLERTIPKMIDIQVFLGENLATINADPPQIDQVLMNLALNARDAMPEGGQLIVETANIFLSEEYARTHVDAKPGHHVLLTVSDSGSGMDRDTLEHLFEPFYTTKAVGEGTGLGLAMVHGIVKQHGGHVTCHSKPGEGSTFKIYFPALISDEGPEQEPVREIPRGGTETILLVDDEEFIRDLGSRILTKAGYKVITACNGTDAVDVYRRRSDEIALVLLDLMMPEMGGKLCFEELTKLNATLKVVIASGYAANGATKDALAAGAKGFVNKPYDIRQVLEVVRHVLDAK